MFIHPDLAKSRIAVNLWWFIHNRKEKAGYAWVAEAMNERLGKEKIHVSRIQKILQQDTSPDWSFVVNLADILGISVEDLGKQPTKAAEKCYHERFPKISKAHSA